VTFAIRIESRNTRPSARLREEGVDVTVQGLDLLGQDLMAGLLAEEHKEFANGAIDGLLLLGLVLAGLAGDGFAPASGWSSWTAALTRRAVILRPAAFSTARSHALWACSGPRPIRGRS